MNRFFQAALLTLIFSVASQSALAENTVISVCNHNSDRAIFATYMRQAGGGAGWQSHGWFKAPANGCTDIDVGVYTGNVYLYAEDEFKSTNWGEGDVRYCINRTDAFVINNADVVDCGDAKLTKVKSDLIVAHPGKNTWDVQPNTAQINFCNQNTTIPVFATHARLNGTMESKGWYQIDAGKCLLVNLGKYAGPVFYHGEYNGGSFAWEGDASPYCVNKTSAFDLFNADQAAQCTAETLKMVKPRKVDVAVGTTTVNFEAVNTSTLLKLCNNTTDKVLESSYALATTDGKWQSTGWTEIQPQKCSTVDLGSYVGAVHLYAEANQGQTYWGSGPFNFCVNKSQGFSIADAANSAACNSDIKLKMVPAFDSQVSAGSNSFNFNP